MLQKRVDRRTGSGLKSSLIAGCNYNDGSVGVEQGHLVTRRTFLKSAGLTTGLAGSRPSCLMKCWSRRTRSLRLSQARPDRN